MASKQITYKPQPSNRVRLVVASSVMLTFISFWRAAAIVLNDLGSSAFYAGGIAEEAVGKSAPWFILGVMLFSFPVRALYVESCSMFTRGGVCRPSLDERGGDACRWKGSAASDRWNLRRNCRARHDLLLVAEHERNRRVE